MKKILVLAALLSFCFSSSASALVAVGVRSSGMGGCGIAISKDTTAAYYNPAGLMRSGMLDLRLGAGVSQQDMTQLISAFSEASDPSKTPEDTFKEKIDAKGAASAFVGLSIAKIGISVVPQVLAVVKKGKDSPNMNFSAGANVSGFLTLGTTLQTPMLPFTTLDIGGNIKSVNEITAAMITDAPAGASYQKIGSGVGLDLGALGEINIPMLTTLTAGLVARDIFETVNFTEKTDQFTIDPLTGKATEVPGAATDEKGNEVAPTTIGAGVAGTIPGLGTLLTSDILMISGVKKDEDVALKGETDMRFGFEQPFFAGLLKFRGGWATGTQPATTLGLGFGLGVNIDIAYVMDGKDSKGNALAVELSGGF